MKVVLIMTSLTLGERYTEFGGIQYPINLGYLAAVLLEKGYEVELWDYNVESFSEGSFKSRLLKSNPSVVGIHAKTPTILVANKLAELIKQTLPGSIVVIGGPHTTPIPIRTLKEFPSIDIVVVGEGELTIVELCDRIKKKEPLSGISGIVHRTNGKIVEEEKRPLIKNLDDLPFPSRDLVDIKKYEGTHVERGLSRKFLNIAEIMVARGCPYQCIFCAGHLSYGFTIRYRSAENVMAEIRECMEKYNINYININDDTITINKGLLYKLCDGLKEVGIRWGCLSRVDTVNKEMFKKMVDSGCIRINLGVESGSPRILKLIKKGITLEQVRNAFKWAHEAGFKIIDGDFMVGNHPSETIEDVKMTLKILKEVKPTFASIAITAPFPGTELNSILKEREYLKKENWEDFVLFGKKPCWRTDCFTAEQLVKLQKWLIRKYYFRPGYIMPMLLKIRNINELKYYTALGFDFIKNVIIKRK